LHPRGWGRTRLAVIWGTGASWAVAIVRAFPLRVFDRPRAGLGFEFFARDLRLRVRFVQQLLLAREPDFELRRRHRAHGSDHARVTAAAENRALAAVHARLQGLEPRVVVVARHGLELAAEFGNPP